MVSVEAFSSIEVVYENDQFCTDTSRAIAPQEAQVRGGASSAQASNINKSDRRQPRPQLSFQALVITNLRHDPQ